MNHYMKQYDTCVNNMYTAYLSSHTPHVPVQTNNAIQLHTHQHTMTVQAQTNTHDIYEYCIHNGIWIPGLINDSQKTLLDILESQEHHYFDMVHNYITCIFTQIDSFCPGDPEFAAICTHPRRYSIKRICVSYLEAKSWKAVQSTESFTLPVQVPLCTILHINTRQNKCFRWSIQETQATLSHTQYHQTRQQMLQSANASFIPDSTFYNNTLQFQTFIAQSYGMKQTAQTLYDSKDYCVKSNQTALYPIHLDLDYKTEIICEMSHMHQIIEHVYQHSEVILCIPFKATRHHQTSYIRNGEILISLHLTCEYTRLRLSHISIPFFLARSTKDLSLDEFKKNNPFIYPHEWSAYESCESREIPPQPRETQPLPPREIPPQPRETQPLPPRETQPLPPITTELQIQPMSTGTQEQPTHKCFLENDELDTLSAMSIESDISCTNNDIPLPEFAYEQRVNISTQEVKKVYALQSSVCEMQTQTPARPKLQELDNADTCSAQIITDDIDSFSDIYNPLEKCPYSPSIPLLEPKQSFSHDFFHNEDIIFDSDISSTDVPMHTFENTKKVNRVDRQRIHEAITPWDTIRVMNESSNETFHTNEKMRNAIQNVMKKNKVIHAFKASSKNLHNNTR